MYIKYEYMPEKNEKSPFLRLLKYINFHYYYFCTFAPLKNTV